MKTKEEYKKIYFDRLKEVERELIEEGVDVSDGTAISYKFDETANAEEVIGFYIACEGDNALNQWRFNTDGIENDFTEQDKEVTRILEALYE